MVSRPARGLLAIAVTAALWGTVPIATNGVYRVSAATPLSVGLFRLAFSLPVLLPIVLYRTGRADWHFSGRNATLLLLFSAAMALYQVCYFAAIPLVGVTVAALITLCTAPILVAALSTVLLRERPGARVLFAMTGAILGTLLLLGSPKTAGTGSETVRGVALALGAALSFALVALSGRALAGRYRDLQLAAIGMAGGALFLLPFALSAGLTSHYSPAGWSLLLYLGIVPTALGYLLFFYGLRYATATVASTVNLLEPLTSTALAWLLFDERLGPAGLLGAALLLGAMALLLRGTKKGTVATVPQA